MAKGKALSIPGAMYKSMVAGVSIIWPLSPPGLSEQPARIEKRSKTGRIARMSEWQVMICQQSGEQQ